MLPEDLADPDESDHSLTETAELFRNDETGQPGLLQRPDALLRPPRFAIDLVGIQREYLSADLVCPADDVLEGRNTHRYEILPFGIGGAAATCRTSPVARFYIHLSASLCSVTTAGFYGRVPQRARARPATPRIPHRSPQAPRLRW